jgi:hypothetical protein
MKRSGFVLAFAAALGVFACVGEITTPENLPGSESSEGGGTTHVACQGKVCVGATALSRLTRDQYRNSVQQLVGDVSVDVDYLPQDQLAAGIFKTTEISPVSDSDIDKYSTVAEAVAESATLEDFLPCDVASGDEACVEALLDDLLPRAYRRDPTPEERAEYLELYQWSIDGGDGFEGAVRLVLSTLLQSPHFLYRMEQGGTDAPRKLSGREVAVRLSYFLWRKAPSAELMAAAAAGELETTAGIESWAREMMASAAFDDTVREFAREWLGIADVASAAVDAERFPDFSPELARSMLEETERFTLDVFRKGDGRQETLLGADYSLIDAELAALYGVDAPASGFARVDLPGRAGVLTHASVLTTFSSAAYTTPIFRGMFVRKRVLCQSLKPRPDNVDELIQELEPSLGPALDDRARLTALTGEEPCLGCHRLTNPIGFAFEGFDAIGKSRTEDYSGSPIDTTSGLDGGGSADYATDVDGEYAGPVELARALAASEDVAKCLSLQWLRFSLGYDGDGDTTSRNAAHARYAAANHDMRELVVAVVLSDAFRHRVSPPVE